MKIKQILINELKYLIGHTPSDSEYLSALNYLSDRADLINTLAKVELALNDWRHDYMTECACCSDYFLPDEMKRDSLGEYCCSDKCVALMEEDYRDDAETKRELQSMWNER